jgi:hypothetical protein
MDLALHDRLLLCFADLASYGIYAQPNLPLNVEEGRVAAIAEIAKRYPDATGSYVFWTAADATRFTPDGNLADGDTLPLYHSGAEVARAVRAVCERLGIGVCGQEEDDTLFVQSY